MNEPCKHIHWRVFDSNRIGFCSCLDCHKEIPLVEPLNSLDIRYTELEARVKILEKAMLWNWNHDQRTPNL